MRLEHVIVHKTPHLYSSHPCVTELQSGEWLVAFNQSAARTPFLHPPADPHYVNLITRSSDRGRTWSEPQMAPDFTWYGVENPGIVQLSSGEVLLNQWKFNWTPRDVAYRRWLAGEGGWYTCPDAGAGRHEWFRADTEEDWSRHAFPYVRSDGGAFVHVSTDEARTWDATVPVDISPYQGAFSPKGAIELDNGDVLLALGSHDYDPLHASFVVKSSDAGRSWSRPVEAARVEGCEFSEPSVAQTSSGKIICMSRDERSGFIYQSDSYDGGGTWTPATRLALWGYPTHIVALQDGRLISIFGRRKPPYGIRAAISEDEGKSWSEEFTVRELPNLNLGYPSVIECEPGRLFAAYYGEDEDQVTCIHGTYFALD